MVKAVIFDLDGVLVHTDGLHFAAWQALAAQLGLPFDQTAAVRMRGVSRMESLEILLGTQAGAFTPAQKQALAQQKNEHYRALAERMTPDDVAAPVRAALQTLRARGLLLAVGSSSKNAGLILRRTALADCFDAVADGNDIQRAKPDPEVFCKAAAALGVLPAEAVVVEDAEAGLAAAVAGGFLPVGVGPAAESPLARYGLPQGAAGLPALLQTLQATPQ